MTLDDRFAGDRERLVQFLRSTIDFVRSLYLEPYDPVSNDPIIPEQFDELMRSAWRQFEQDFDQAAAEQRIRSLTPQQLRGHGLYGAQLTLKLAVINWLFDNWRQEGHKWLKKLIDAIDVLLDSLLQATNITTAIKEAKDIISTLLD